VIDHAAPSGLLVSVPIVTDLLPLEQVPLRHHTAKFGDQ
jgi:hypothetical protein